jgi:hypothetical protein
MGQLSSKARPSARGVACPPQWLPVLLCIATPPSLLPPSPPSPLLPPPPPPSPSPPSFPPLSPPPPSASPPPTPSPPPSTEMVVLMLTASGSVNDYANTSGLQSSIAEAAGVSSGAVAIRVEAASVRITALINNHPRGRHDGRCNASAPQWFSNARCRQRPPRHYCRPRDFFLESTNVNDMYPLRLL